MKKTILKVTAISAFLLLLVFNVTTTMDSIYVSFGGSEALAFGNTVDCFSMFESDCEWFEDCSDFYDCGPCSLVDNYSDWQLQGTCEYSPSPGTG